MEPLEMTVLDAITSRKSTRAFLNKSVPKEILEKVLEYARWSPSGGNLQPWQVAVVTGNVKKQLSAALLNSYNAGEEHKPDYLYYPQQWFEPFKTRRFQTGMALYNALDIPRDDKQRRQQQWQANYDFFGAPVGLFFMMDKRLEDGSLIDLGMFMQSVMLAAQAFNLSTCPQVSVVDYPGVVRTQLGLSDNWRMICGMALGYSDVDHPVNNYRTVRESISDFTTWYE